MEILGPEEDNAPPEWIECYVISNLEPKFCGPLARDLNAILPLRISSPSSNSDDDASSRPITDDEHVCIFPNTDHLKRIRRRPATDDEMRAREASAAATCHSNGEDNGDGKVTTAEESCASNKETCENPTKRAKKSKSDKQSSSRSICYSLDILVGSVAAVDNHMHKSISLATILDRYNLFTTSSNYIRKSLPGRPAHTKDELDHWNQSVWPTLFYEEKTAQYNEEKLALTSEEIEMMKRGMNESVQDAIVGQEQLKEWKNNVNDGDKVLPTLVFGVVVINPHNGVIVSKSSDERRLQAAPESGAKLDSIHGSKVQWISFPEEANPLCTPVLLALEGVSRKERQAALGCGMGSDEFQKGQVSIEMSDC